MTFATATITSPMPARDLMAGSTGTGSAAGQTVQPSRPVYTRFPVSP